MWRFQQDLIAEMGGSGGALAQVRRPWVLRICDAVEQLAQAGSVVQQIVCRAAEGERSCNQCPVDHRLLLQLARHLHAVHVHVHESTGGRDCIGLPHHALKHTL